MSLQSEGVAARLVHVHVCAKLEKTAPRRRDARLRACRCVAGGGGFFTPLVPRRFPLPMPWSCAQLEP